MALLSLKFKSDYSFNKAINHFNNNSNYCPDNINNEFRSIDFIVNGQDEANILESFIDSELNKSAYIQDYYFEFED